MEEIEKGGHSSRVYFLHILCLNLKISYHILSVFDMYIDLGERIAGKQHRPSLIIEDPPSGPPKKPKIYFFFTFWLMYEKLVFKIFPLVHVSIVMRAAFADISVPLADTPGVYKGPTFFGCKL